MKRILTIFVATALAAGVCEAQQAFRHLGMSLEVGSTGAGINLSYPLITNRLIMTVGANLPQIPISSSFTLSSAPLNAKMALAVEYMQSYNDLVDLYYNDGYYDYYGRPMEHINIGDLQTRIEDQQSLYTKLKAKLNLECLKVMFEIYPTKSYFHFTIGAFISNGDWMTFHATCDHEVWDIYKEMVQKYEDVVTLADWYKRNFNPDFTIPEVENVGKAAQITIHNQTFAVDPETGELDARLVVNRIKPYLGVGFGSSVPTKRRLGAQLELGMYYQGKPTFKSDQSVSLNSSAYNDSKVDDVVKTVIHFQWFPQVTLRFTGRLF